MHYVVGDIHGSYEDMQLMINKINSQDPEAVIIFVGDFVDRGNDVPLVLDWCMKNIHENGKNLLNSNKYQSVRGNHEDMIIDWYYQDFRPWWFGEGFTEDDPPGPENYIYMPATHYDFSKRAVEMGIATPDKLAPYIRFFESLPYNKTVEVRGLRYRIVHAFYDPDMEEDSEEQNYLNIWGRREGNYANDDIIVHGHTPTAIDEYILNDRANTKPGMVSYRRNDINVDGGCVFGGKADSEYPLMLCAICLETLREIYPYSIPERFKMNLLGMRKKYGPHNFHCQNFAGNMHKYVKNFCRSLEMYESDEMIRMRQRLSD